MHAAIGSVCNALDALSAATLAGWSGDQTFTEAWGWNCPCITRHDLAYIPKSLSDELKLAAVEKLSPEQEKLLSDFPRRINLIQTSTLPQVYSGNNSAACQAYMLGVGYVRQKLLPFLPPVRATIPWETVEDTKAMPSALARRLKSLKAEIDLLVPDKEELAGQIKQVREATDAAEALPTTLQDLTEASAQVRKIAADSTTLLASIQQNSDSSLDKLRGINEKATEAEKLVSNCESAYRITTTKGLAGAFEQRASRLGWSMWVWVLGLTLSLYVGVSIGTERIRVLSLALAAQDPQWGVVSMHAFLSVLSLGAPIWFGWIATKQIGQRFRLAEDYGFKASVAKAYEGYRREAARIDPDFEKRLFASTLTRLEEAPLRLVEADTHGSPWHEFVASESFKNLVAKFPDLGQALREAGRKLASPNAPISSPPNEEKKPTAG